MKFGEPENKTAAMAVKENVPERNVEQNGVETDSEENMRASSEAASDVFQAGVYNSGKWLLKQLEQYNIGAESSQASYQELQEQLTMLRDFNFNIGFAGGMSSGKSTVINSLIEYPLMPTCKLTTTCVGTHLFYGEKPRVSVVDDDTGERVLDVDCTKITAEHFQKLKEYACITTHVKIIENLQHFTDHNLFEDKDSFQPEMLNMSRDDPNHVIILLMILLTVYVDQNSVEMNQKTKIANAKRQEVLNYFNFDPNTLNYTIHLQWNGDFLKSGMSITDLPGLGAYAPDKDMGNGKTMKGHDSISTDAIKKTDAMVFLVDPQVDGTGVPALTAMISNARLKEIVNRSDLVIPVLNKVDDCNGQSEVKQAVDKFVDILKNTGVNKTPEDIHLYSAWYGECKFPDFPIEKTCFYFRNANSIRSMLRTIPMFKNMPEAQLEEMVKSNAQAQLQDSYDHAGIKELKEFFRAVYISKSKNQRSQAAVFAIRKLALDVIEPMRNLLKNYEILKGVTGTAIDDISQNLKKSVDAPISAALMKISEQDHHDYYVTEKLDDIPAAYSVAFDTALAEYKERNLGICDHFALGWLGFSDNARIDQPGSPNKVNFDKLTKEMEQLDIDVKNVNEKFGAVLRHVTRETQTMYTQSLRILQELKTDIPVALDQFSQNYAQISGDDESIAAIMKALRDALLSYMEKQIDIIEDSMRVNQDTMDKAGNETVEKILELNAQMIGLYTKSIVNQVHSTAMSRGIWLTNREYVKITGSGGLREIFASLTLSTGDRQYIENEVRSIGIVSISNNLDSWYQDTENAINMNFTELRDKLAGMMDDTVKELSGSAAEIEERRKMLEEKLKAVENDFAVVRDKIQPLYADSLEQISSETLRKYEGNILSGIVG